MNTFTLTGIVAAPVLPMASAAPTRAASFAWHARRATRGDWAEGSNAIYLDNQFTREWLARMKELGWK